MTSVQNKVVMGRFFKAFEVNDQTALRELLGSDLVAYHPGSHEPLGRDALLQVIDMFTGAFSDQEYTIEDQIAEGDKVVSHVPWRATHSGDFQGLPASGTRVEVSGISIDRISDGRIVEHQVLMDQMGLMQQVGAVPPPQAARAR